MKRPFLVGLDPDRQAGPYVMAHRGDRENRPENTLSAFRKAIDDGAEILETDLHLSADDEFICIHDSTVDRTTNGSGEVAKLSLVELKGLKAGVSHTGYADERIPTLAELAAILPEGIALALELKSDRFLDMDVVLKLRDELAIAGVLQRSFILSFSEARLAAVKRNAPELEVGWITMSTPWPRHGMRFLGPYWPILFLNPFYVLIAHLRGQIVCPLDPHPDKRLWYYRLLGCDAVLSDHPGETVRKLRKTNA
jgi:glycerophosphoryl diester phosphodiesterase